MTFFFDVNLSPKMVKAIRQVDCDAVHLRDHFPGETKDEDWLEFCAQKRWVGVTHDRNILSKPHLKQRLMQVGVALLFLPKSKNAMNPREQVIFFLEAWSAMEEAATAARPNKCLFQLQANRKLTPIT